MSAVRRGHWCFSSLFASAGFAPFVHRGLSKTMELHIVHPCHTKCSSYAFTSFRRSRLVTDVLNQVNVLKYRQRTRAGSSSPSGENPSRDGGGALGHIWLGRDAEKTGQFILRHAPALDEGNFSFSGEDLPRVSTGSTVLGAGEMRVGRSCLALLWSTEVLRPRRSLSRLWCTDQGAFEPRCRMQGHVLVLLQVGTLCTDRLSVCLQSFHPIHNQVSYLNSEFLSRLEREEGESSRTPLYQLQRNTLVAPPSRILGLAPDSR